MSATEPSSPARTVRRRVRALHAGGTRGSAQIGLAVVAAVVAGGMVLGHGLAAHVSKSSYPLTWLADSSRGQLVQVDPAAGRSNLRLQIGEAGNPLTIQQGDGTLVVVDGKTGVISTVDLSTLLVGGSRMVQPAGQVKVLLAGERMYVVNLAAGTVQAVNPTTTAAIGKPWSAGHPLVDATVDGRNQLWVLEGGQKLVQLTWASSESTLKAGKAHSVPGAGPGSVIISHKHGVTVVGSSGNIDQVGTDHDSTISTPPVTGPINAPQNSPDNLVAISSPSNSTVIIYNGDKVIVDQVGRLGCNNPGIPALFNNRVYVPCRGAGQVIVLGPDGRPAHDAIPTPDGGDPQLVLSDGRLLLNVAGANAVTVVDGSGSTYQIPTAGPNINVQKPTPPPSPTPTKSHQNNDGNGDAPGAGNGNGNGDGNHNRHTSPRYHRTPSPTPTPSSTSNVPTDVPDSGTATAKAQNDGSVDITWASASGRDATNFTVTLDSDGTEVATAPAGSTSATVTVLDPGIAAKFVVTAYEGSHVLWTDTTDQVTTYTRPGDAKGVTVSAVGPHSGTATLNVAWTGAPNNGASVTYLVQAPGASPVQVTATTASIDVPCSPECSGTVTVTPQNLAGDGGVGTASYHAGSAPSTPTPTPTTQPAQPLPGAGESFVTVTGGTVGNDNLGTAATVDLALNAPADWASWTEGTCALWDGTLSLGAIDCNTTGVARTLSYFESGTHTYKVVATGPHGTSTSLAVTRTVTYRLGGCVNSASERILTGPAAGGPAVQLPPCDDCPGTRSCVPRSQTEHRIDVTDAIDLRARLMSVLKGMW